MLIRFFLIPGIFKTRRNPELTRRHALGNASGNVMGKGFFSQIGVDASTTPAAAASARQSAGDQMLQAVVFHSDHLELSEQFDATSGFEKSVSNLSWSYASFLSAIRAKKAF